MEINIKEAINTLFLGVSAFIGFIVFNEYPNSEWMPLLISALAYVLLKLVQSTLGNRVLTLLRIK